MRAGVYYSNSDLRIEEPPRPVEARGEILVRIAASGVCGSDVLEWYRIKKAPLVLGHEVAGTVAEVGPGVSAWKVDDRVAVTHHVPCNTCPSCLGGHHTACATLHTTNFDPGGFCEYVRVPALQTDRGVFRLPDEVSFDEGTFAEPLGCVVRAQRLARVGPGDSVLVMGSGISGLLHIALARALGAGTILATDVNPWRLEAALRFGAAAAFPAGEDVPERVAAATAGRMVDRVIVCTGAIAAVSQSMRLVAAGGTVLFFGAPDQEGGACIPFPEIRRREITLQTSYGAAPADLAIAIELIRARRVPVAAMVTHRFTLSLDTAKVEDALFKRGGVEVAEFVDAPQAASVYGLDAPLLKVTVKAKGESWIELGNKDGSFYARRSGDSAVLKLDPAKAEELLKAFTEL